MISDYPGSGREALLESQIQALQVEVSLRTKAPKKVEVFNKGYVELYDWMGDDLRIVNMARQSFGQESTEMGDYETGLVNFLMRERHGTPFEGPVFTFNVKCPIFVAREWFRHRIGSFNEYSGRYSEMTADVYIPDAPQIRTQVGKPGNYTFETMDCEQANGIRQDMQVVARECWDLYQHLLNRGVAKEVARMVLGVNQYTQFTWVVNFRALLNFISLRSDDNAMWEIRQYSQEIEKLIKPIVPVAYESFVTHGRVCP
jgi:thymidylate synthase (FAD)